MKEYICKQCECSFENNKGCKSYTPKFCSKKCYSESMKMKKPCLLCGKIIENKHSVSLKNRVYCSKECQSEARRNVPLSEDWKKALSHGRKNSEKCKGKNLYNWKGGKENQKRLTLKRHYRKKASGFLDFNYLDILYKLQKGKCYYCNETLDGKKNKAIEHLRPLSKGGNNEWINLVYSCKSCNSKKNNMTLVEFAIKNSRMDWLNNMVQFYANKINNGIQKTNTVKEFT